jgi:hypothetical protein
MSLVFVMLVEFAVVKFVVLNKSLFSKPMPWML